MINISASDRKIIFDHINAVMQYFYDKSDINTIPELKYLFHKNLSNITAIRNLVEYNFLHEAYTVARSLIESSINFIYLLKNPDKRFQYQEESQMLLFKNAFIVLKLSKSGMIEQVKIPINELENSMEETLNNLSTNNKKIILNAVGADDFTMTNEVYERLDSFFRNYKPLFMRIEDMYKQLQETSDLFEDVNQEDYKLSLRDMTYCDYNECSQFTHTIFPIQQPDTYRVIRICPSFVNVMIGVMRKHYKLDITPELAQSTMNCYKILHPEDI
jgi:hypothetical protein